MLVHFLRAATHPGNTPKPVGGEALPLLVFAALVT